MRKSEIDIYDGLPSVNVKVYGAWSWEQLVPKVREEYGGDPRFTEEWITEHINDDRFEDYFQFACESEFEYTQGYAEEIFPDHRVKLELAGRSGGHLVALGLGDVEDWDAVMVAKWAKLAKLAREIADGIPFQLLGLIYINAFWSWCDEQDEQAAEDAAAQLPIVAGV